MEEYKTTYQKMVEEGLIPDDCQNVLDDFFGDGTNVENGTADSYYHEDYLDFNPDEEWEIGCANYFANYETAVQAAKKQGIKEENILAEKENGRYTGWYWDKNLQNESGVFE